MTRVLIVGCGAVGQVYGLALQKAGVTLGYLDRPATAAKLKQALDHGGIPLFQITYRRRQEPIPRRLVEYSVIMDEAESRDFKPDQIWFTTPSPVYYSPWFREFQQNVPAERVVCFAPEGLRPEFFPENDVDRLVFAGTTFMAWQGGPKCGGGRPEGVNFWLPPLGIPITGAQSACRDVERLLKQAGFRVSIGKRESHSQASATAVMTAFMAGLELSGWSLGGFRRSHWLGHAASAAREAVLSQIPAAGKFSRLLLGIFISRGIFSLATILLPLLIPFDLEKYLKFHYTKTRDQTLTLLELFEKDAISGSHPAGNIQALHKGLLGSA